MWITGCNKKCACVASISFFFFHLRQSVAQKPLLLASAASRSPVTLGRPTVTRLGENNNLPKNQEVKREKKKESRECCHRNRLFKTLSPSSSCTAAKPKEQENNIAFEMSSYNFRPYSVRDVWWYTCRKRLWSFSFLATAIIIWGSSVYK